MVERGALEWSFRFHGTTLVEALDAAPRTGCAEHCVERAFGGRRGAWLMWGALLDTLKMDVRMW